MAELLTSENARFGIMLSGKYGNGKTTLLYALQNLMAELSDMKFFKRFDQKYGYETYIKTLNIIEARELTELARDPKAFLKLKKEPYLAIDDLGREPKEIIHYGSVINPIMELFEYRYDRQLPTLTTTNLTPSKIREKYDNRIADRFNEMFEIIVFEDKSFRQ